MVKGVFLMIFFFQVYFCVFSQRTTEERRDSLSRLIRETDSDHGTSFVYILDGLFLSQNRFDSLRLFDEEIRERKRISPLKAYRKYGLRGANGAVIINTRKLIILNNQLLNDDETKGILLKIDGNRIHVLKNIDENELFLNYNLKHKYGGILIKTK